MRKLIFALLVLSSLAWGQFSPSKPQEVTALPANYGAGFLVNLLPGAAQSPGLYFSLTGATSTPPVSTTWTCVSCTPGSGGGLLIVQNNFSTGTICNELVSADQDGNAIVTPGGSATGVLGIAHSGCGTSGFVSVSVTLQETCLFDTPSPAGPTVGVSSQDGLCTDGAGQGQPVGVLISQAQNGFNGFFSLNACDTLGCNVAINIGQQIPSTLSANAIISNPAAATNIIQPTTPNTPALIEQCNSSSPVTQFLDQKLDPGGLNIAGYKCDGSSIYGPPGSVSTWVANHFVGPNPLSAVRGIVNGASTDLIVCLRDPVNPVDNCISQDGSGNILWKGATISLGSLTGDVTLAGSAATVVRLQGYPVNNTQPTVVGQRLENDGTQWSPAGPGFSATNLTSGTVADARLSANIPLLNASNVFTGATQTFGSGNGGSFTTGELNSVSIDCAPQSYVICGSAVDAGGHPSYISQGTCGGGVCALTINGAGFLAYIQGIHQVGSGTYTNAIGSLAPSTFQYVYLKLDTTNANSVAADFAATILAPVYSYKAPTACTGATAGAPQYWFDASSNQWKVSTAAACSFSVASPQVVFLGVGRLTAAPVLTAFVHEPFFLDPYERIKQFGDGFDTIAQAGTDIAKVQISGGTTTVDNQHTYTAFEVVGTGIVSPTAFATSGATQGVAVIYSQNPVIVSGASASVNANGLGRLGGALATSACNIGNASGFAGAGGGGGGASATNAGCNGGNRTMLASLTTGGQGTGGAIATIGNNATSTPTAVPLLLPPFTGLIGAGGGSGGGDGAGNSGGSGAAGGGFVLIRAPSVLIDTTATLSADAGAAVAGAGTNGGGGGGGGGGTAACQAYFCIISGTNTANGSVGAAGLGGGKAGGNGTNGIVQNWNMR